MQRILQPGEIEALDRVEFPRVRLPEATTLFQGRAARLRQLAPDNPIGDYLFFAARLVEAQHRLVVSAAAPASMTDGGLAGALARDMPPLSLSERLPAAAWRELLRALVADLSAATAVEVPQSVLEQLAAADDTALDTLAHRALTDSLEREDLKAAPLVMAALQVLYVVRAAGLGVDAVRHAETATVCPVCGSPPVASVLRIGGEAGGHRYLHCGLCATEWHMVRVKCSQCESTKGIRYQGIAGMHSDRTRVGDQVVLAETCDICHAYRKIVNQERDPHAEPLADDLGSLALDLLLGSTEVSRASANPLLAIEPSWP